MLPACSVVACGHQSANRLCVPSFQSQAQRLRAALFSVSVPALHNNIPPSRQKQELLGRYKVVPVTLYRIQNGENVRLREHSEQKRLGRISFDYKLQPDGLVHPKKGPLFEDPNGMSTRAVGPVLQEFIRTFRSKWPVVYEIPKGLELPDDLVLLHEHTDHFSFQCDVPMSSQDLNSKLTAMMKSHPCRTMTIMEWADENPY
ncbi:hypothetical protein BC831DRAFT_489973 [Entophlyctis helioformis]|nr:hypothetical protein BC831DRAFT_489973 [Entophlyctis helioformis]